MSVRPLLAAAILAGLALTGCASGSGSSPTAASDPPAEESELAAAWLDDGTTVGVVTWGSSTCVPTAGDVSADGQTVTVDLAVVDEDACTMDYVPRATAVALPEGVDPASDVEIVVTGVADGIVTLAGDDALTGTATEQPSAGWYDATSFVILTYGSSGCLPAVESVTADSDTALTVTFVDPPEDQVCTADYAPQATVATAPEGFGDADEVELTLTGGGVEATTTILGTR